MIVPAVKCLICPQRTLNSVRVLKLTYTTQYPGNKPCVSDSMDSDLLFCAFGLLEGLLVR